MSDPSDYDDVTTQEKTGIYESSEPIFRGILVEVRELSKKKPEATMSSSKVLIVNRVLSDLLNILKDEQDAKYLELLNDDALPQVSDAVLVMVQFETALASFERRYNRWVNNSRRWITHEFLKAWEDGENEDYEGDVDSLI